MKKYLLILLMPLLIVLYMALLIVLYKVNKVHSINTLIGLSIDKTGITKNSYDIHVEDELRPYIYIYWLGDNGTKKTDRLLLYNQTIYQGIPDYYGKNRIVIETKSNEILYDKIEVFKLYGFSKHNYTMNVKLNDTLLIVDWSIDNWYSKKISITDTINYKQ